MRDPLHERVTGGGRMRGVLELPAGVADYSDAAHRPPPGAFRLATLAAQA